MIDRKDFFMRVKEGCRVAILASLEWRTAKRHILSEKAGTPGCHPRGARVANRIGGTLVRKSWPRAFALG